MVDDDRMKLVEDFPWFGSVFRQCWLQCCDQVSSRLRETSLEGVGNLSTAVTEMKQAFDARILALELHVIYKTFWR